MTAQRATEQEWVIWNELLGALDTVLIGKIDVSESGSRTAHLRAPYEMVGPFDLDELESRRFIHFAACVVMSRLRWREEQTELRRRAREKRRQFARQRRADQQRSYEREDAYGRSWGRASAGLSSFDRRRYRNLLELPLETMVSRSAINSAFRRLAKSAHPDSGGSHEAFVRLTQARDALLADVS
jgi:hypothetical protein